jgi:hypothetical protein
MIGADRTGLLVAFVGGLLLALGAADAADEKEADTVTIKGETCTVVPDEELREFGYDVPDVKPEDNAAYDYIEAINGYVAPNAEQGELRDKVIQDKWTEKAGPLADYIERNEDTLNRIHAAAKKDVCHFPLMVPLGSSIEERRLAGTELRQLAPMRELGRFLVTEGKAYEFETRYEEALDTYLLALRLGNQVAQDPTLIGGLVGLGCNQIGTRAIEQCLVRNEIDDDVLLKAQKRLAELAEGRPSVMVAMGGERAWSTSIAEYLITHPHVVYDFVKGAYPHPKTKAWKVAMAAMMMSDEGRAQMRADVKAFWDATDAAMAMPLSEFIETGAGDEPARKAQARDVPPNIMGMIGPAPGSARIAFARNDVSWTVLDVEFALARYAAADGQYPASLDALKDLMLSDGLDPYSGKPLHYRLEADGSYTLWSVGENLEDDGGVVGAKCPDCQAKDFVWNSAVIHGEE